MKRALLFLAALAACENSNDHEPVRHPSSEPAHAPETEPLPVSPRRFMIDPRGPADAGTDAS